MRCASSIAASSVAFRAPNWSSSELPSEHQTPFGAAHFMSGTVISEGGNEKPQRLRVELDLVAQSERDVERLRGSPDGELNLGTGLIGAQALLAKVTDDRISYVQFLEDTFGTASSFRTAGTWLFRGVATGGDVSVGS